MRRQWCLNTVVILSLCSSIHIHAKSYDSLLNDVLGDKYLKPVPEHCGKSRYHSQHRSYISRLKRVVGGQISKQGEWPWLVTMQLKKNGTETFEHLCGGTLIHPQWVLTAAHCFENIWADFLTDDPRAWMIRIGEHNLFKETEQHIDIPPEIIILNPNRNPQENINLDIALVKLSHPVKIHDAVNVACLPSKDDYIPPGTVCVTAGWGHTAESGNISDIVRHVRIPIISNGLCNRLYGRIGHAVKVHISQDMLCAGLDTGGKDACQYDSGGPLVCFDETDDQWQLTGVVMTGYGCARAGFPGIYTRVGEFVPWVEETIARN